MSFSYIVNAEWDIIKPNLNLEFPQDHGSHPTLRTEWWYVTGNLTNEKNRSFGYQLTFFRRGIDPSIPDEGESKLCPKQVLIGHLAIADIQNNTFKIAQKTRRLDNQLAYASNQDMDVWIENWEMKRYNNNTIELSAYDHETKISIEFKLKPVKPITLHGLHTNLNETHTSQTTGSGYSKKGPEDGNANAYMSWTRLNTEGSLMIDNQLFQITGESWFDHEWGTSQLGKGVIGWDWFGLHLEDGRDLMIYVLRKKENQLLTESAGTLIDKNGVSHHLTNSDFTLTSSKTWISPNTKGKYPAKWNLNIPSQNIDIIINTRISNAEMDTRKSIGVVYWEGPVSISGTTTGYGYAELTGYVNPLGEL